MVDDLEDQFVVLPDGGWSIRRKTKICSDHANIFDYLASRIPSDEFSFRNILGCNWPGLGTPGNGATSHSSGIPTIVDAILMGILPRLASTYVPGSVCEDNQGTEGRSAAGMSNTMLTTGNEETREGHQ